MERKVRTRRKCWPKRQTFSSRSASCRWSWCGSNKSLNCSDAHELRKLVDYDDSELTISRHCELLGLHKSTLYYRPSPVREPTLWIMVRIAALYLEDLCSGIRRLVGYLAREGIPNRRNLLRNLMWRMRFTGDSPEPPNHSSSTSIRAVSLPCGCHHDQGF